MISPSTDQQHGLDELARSWRLALAVGTVTMLLGAVVVAEPGASLIVIAVLVGVQFIVFGLFRLIRSFTDDEAHHDRVLFGVLGVLAIVVGVLLVRHLDLTLLLVSTLVGVTWIVLGVSELAVGLTAGAFAGRGWLIGTGLLGVVAGIIILAYPVGTLHALALLLGVWLIVRGIAEIWGALAVRRLARSG